MKAEYTRLTIETSFNRECHGSVPIEQAIEILEAEIKYLKTAKEEDKS